MIRRSATTWELSLSEEAQAAHRAVARVMRGAGPTVIPFPVYERAREIQEEYRRCWHEVLESWHPTEEQIAQGEQDALEAMMGYHSSDPPAA